MEGVGDQQHAAIEVVVCDDHPATARGLACLLAAAAADIHVVGVAFSGLEAEELVRQLSPDLVIMDLYMPGVSGIEATRRIRAASPGTNVMILTMSTLEEDLHEALSAGATGYVTKDRDVADIVSALRAVQLGQLTIPAGIAGGFLRILEHGGGNGLTDEERKIMLSLGAGMTNRQIGEEIHLSERTVRRRVKDIHAKLAVSDPRGAAAYAARVGSLYASQAAVWSESARRRLAASRQNPGDPPRSAGPPPPD